MLYSHGGSRLDANDSVSVIADMIVSGSTVLDVGCGAGDLGMLLKSKNCRVWGIEYEAENAAASEQTNAYEKIYRLDMNNFRADMLTESFDYIVCADVLEHLVFPEQALFQLKKLLNENAKVIVSVPNIAHASVKANLLLNDWTYTELGILDKTHLRFFTAKSFIVFLSNLGLKIEKWETTTLDEDGYQPHRLKELPENIVSFIRQDVFSEVMQFIALAGVSSSKNLLKHNEEYLSMGKKYFSGSKFLFKVKRLLLVKFPNFVKYIQKLR